MKLAKVTGKVWATVKAPSMEGDKLLIVNVIDNNTNQTLVVADALDAGISDTVIITGGSAARIGGGNLDVPIDATVIAIVDEKKNTSIGGEKSYV